MGSCHREGAKQKRIMDKIMQDKRDEIKRIKEAQRNQAPIEVQHSHEIPEEKAEEEAALARTCPKCENKNGTTVRRPNWAGVLAVITLGAFALFYPWPKFICPDCKHKWK